MRALIAACLVGLGVQAASVGQEATPPPVRPPDDIPFARLKADAVLAVALGAGAVSTDDGIAAPIGTGVVRVAASSNAPSAPVPLAERPCGSLVEAFGSLWAPLCGAGRLARIDVKTSAVTAPLTLALADASGRIATGVGSVWVASEASGIVSRVDPDTNDVVAEIRVAARPSSVVFDDDTVWVTSATGNLLTRINAHTNQIVTTVKVGPRPGRLAVGEGAVWTLNQGDGSVSRVDPKTDKVTATIAVGAALAAGEIAAGLGSVWLSAPGVPLLRIDPRTSRAAQRFTGEGGGAVLVAHGSLWVAAAPAATWRLDPLLVSAMRP